MAAAATGLLVAPVAPAAQATPPAWAAVLPAMGGAAPRTITLVTGDRVSITDDGGLLVYRFGDRDGVTYLAHESGPSVCRPERCARDDPQQIPSSTLISMVWTFRSGHVDGDEPVSPPLLVIGFKPRLDQHNVAPAGQAFLVPVEVVGQPGSDAVRLRRLRVEVSYDDGASWHPAPVFADRFAQVNHPAGEGFVSLRASATDRAGDAVEQTAIRAYMIA